MIILWLLKHKGGEIMIQIGNAMCHWIQLVTSRHYYYYSILQFMHLLCQICTKHHPTTKIGLPRPVRVKLYIFNQLYTCYLFSNSIVFYYF
jgi:hypothetical protein